MRQGRTSAACRAATRPDRKPAGERARRPVRPGRAFRYGAGDTAARRGARVDHPHRRSVHTAGRRLDQHRKADALGLLGEQLGRLVVAVIARHQRHLGLFHDLLGFALGAHGADGGGRRADEDDARLGAGLGEAGILRQEAVAGMDRLRAGVPGRRR